MKNEIQTRLDRIEETEIRSEYKLWMYKHYTLPSIRFILTVHDMTKTDLKKLDNFCHKYMKKWAGLPPCATNSIFHLKSALDIPSVTSVYEEAHFVNHADARLKSDNLVNHALDSRYDREKDYTRKHSTTVAAENAFQRSLMQNSVQGEVPEFTAKEVFRSDVKDGVKGQARSNLFTLHTEHVSKLAKQGPLINLSLQEGQDLTWKAFAFNLKKGTLKFILNSTLDTLPTNANLLQWKKSVSDKCGLCNGRQTNVHVLSACPVALQQKRLTWRHDCIVNYIAKCVDKQKFKMYADIPEFQTSAGGTLTPDILVTSERPDIVIIDGKKNTINIFELTVPFEHNVDIRHSDKTNKYAYMKEEITKYKPNIEPFEIGARGYITKENRSRLKTIYSYCTKDITLKHFEQNVAKLAMDGSRYIYLCRNQTEWVSPPLLSVD